jgi:hypothetical protein
MGDTAKTMSPFSLLQLVILMKANSCAQQHVKHELLRFAQDDKFAEDDARFA